MKRNLKNLWFAGVGAIGILACVLFWYAIPFQSHTIRPVSVLIEGPQRIPKADDVTVFFSLEDLRAEVGSATCSIAPPVDFSRHALVRVGWVPGRTADATLRHTVRLGGLKILFFPSAPEAAESGEPFAARNSWFVVSRHAAVGFASVGEIVQQDLQMGLAILALSLLVVLARSWMHRRDRAVPGAEQLEPTINAHATVRRS